MLGYAELSHLCSKLEEACNSGAEIAGPFERARTEAQVAHRNTGEGLGLA